MKLLLASAIHTLSACKTVVSSKPDIEIVPAHGTGHVTLIGDAAHPMSPMGGSGADTAIQNAADLAQTLAAEGKVSTSFLSKMENRAKRKIEHSFTGGQKLWGGKKWSDYNEVASES